MNEYEVRIVGELHKLKWLAYDEKKVMRDMTELGLEVASIEFSKTWEQLVNSPIGNDKRYSKLLKRINDMVERANPQGA